MIFARRVLQLATVMGLCGFGLLRAQEPPAGTEPETKSIETLQAEIERLNRIVPGQAVAMTQVAYNFSNLWFAMHAENWPLAQFYFNETRVRLRWALRIQPARRLASGELELGPLLERLEGNQLAAVGASVEGHDLAQFEAAYRSMLDGCYGCHVASEKPYLKLRVPNAPAETLIDFAAH
jgi:hypothetical protein